MNSVANKFGGGGHKNAAGCTTEAAYPEVRRKIADELSRVLT